MAYKTIKQSDISKIDNAEDFKLCYVDDIPRVISDYTPDSRALLESDEYKAEYERCKKLEEEEMKLYGHSESMWYRNKFNDRLKFTNYFNPEYIVGESSHYAYFSPINPCLVIGDDWNDVPYEYNAEIPYDYIYEGGERKEFDVIKIPFYLPSIGHAFPCFSAELPRHLYDDESALSLEEINMGRVPWIWCGIYKNTSYGIDKNASVSIMAGCNIPTFLRKISEAMKMEKEWSILTKTDIESVLLDCDKEENGEILTYENIH